MAVKRDRPARAAAESDIPRREAANESAEATHFDPLPPELRQAMEDSTGRLHDVETGPMNVFDEGVLLPNLEPASTDPTMGILESVHVDFEGPEGARGTRAVEQRLTVGRHTNNDIQLLDPEVSKQHLIIERQPDGAFSVEDKGSANGTLLNGVEIRMAHLVDGDVIEAGNSRLWFRHKRVPTNFSPATSDKERPAEVPLSEHAGPIAFELPFTDSVRDDSKNESTVVTLVPMIDEREEGTNVFAMSMVEDFRPANVITDDDLRRDYERLRVAYDVALEIGINPDLQAMGNDILHRVRSQLPCDTAVIMLRDEDGELVPLASIVDGNKEEVRIPRAIVEQVIATQEGLLTKDAQADAQLRSSHTVVGQQIRSALCVPLIAGTDIVGVIHLSSSSAAGAYEERDLAMLRAIAQPAALAVANARLIQRTENDARTRAVVSRFLSPALVEQVLNRNLSLTTGGDKVQCTVLFSDIRGFTAMSDGAAPEAVVRMLNEYFEAMVEIVFDYGGTLDKFLGDGLMAVWGTPVQTENDAEHAVRAAQRMREVLDRRVNVARSRRGEPALTAGYGMATGMVISGGIGGRRRQDFTVIGDTVNLASRLCSQAAPGQVLCCEKTREACSSSTLRLDALEERVVKGVARPVPVFELP